MVSADAVDLEEVGIVAAAAGPPVLVDRARALLVGGHAGGVAAGPVPDDVAVVDDVGGRDRPAIVLGTAVEQGAGDLGGGVAGLGRPVVELGDLEVAVAADAGQRIRGPDLRSRTSRCRPGRSRPPGRCRR